MSDGRHRTGVEERPGPAARPGPAPDGPATPVLEETAWRARQVAHRERVRAWSGPHRARAARGETHPVYDFLWHYYSVRPAVLERWHPGAGVTLTGPDAYSFLRYSGYVATAKGVAADARTLSRSRLDSVRWIASLLRGCTGRPPVFSCFGLHEWAMVYRTDAIRHATTALRFPPDEIARIVESLPVRCSHFDAFRFFTAAARPLNRLQPAKETRLELDERGCLHVNMDLYKWAVKLLPFAPSELVADCFELALAARELDMRASPYDVRHLGFEAVRIETTEGRAEYEREQRALAARAEPLRGRLLETCTRVVGMAENNCGDAG